MDTTLYVRSCANFQNNVPGDKTNYQPNGWITSGGMWMNTNIYSEFQPTGNAHCNMENSQISTITITAEVKTFIT